jgi:signal transduction histidine kinase
MCALAATALVLALTVISLVRAERRATLENEIMGHMRDLAQLVKQNGVRYIWQSGLPPMWGGELFSRESYEWKINEILDLYMGQISQINAYGYGYKANLFTAGSGDIKMIEQLQKVMAGEEIKVQGIFNESAGVVTFGVPYMDLTDTVAGALLLHMGASALTVYSGDIINYTAFACAISMALGTILVYVIARRQVKPIKRIQRAVSSFASGNFNCRVEETGDDELAELAGSFNKMAAELGALEESRRTFVANVSHELRSPMTSISGYAQGMLDGTIGANEQSKYLNVILSETNRLTYLVNELLELSRYESEMSAIAAMRIDVNALILKIMFEYEQRIEEKQLAVQFSLEGQQMFALADPDKLTQVVSNLIDNAVKFSDRGGSILIKTQSADNVCAIAIKNTGPVIAPEDMPFVFDRFYKGDKAHTAGNGTGLGLSIVKKIIEQHGQAITAASFGGETEFTFTLKKA